VSWDLPSLAPGITSLLDVTVTGCRVGDLADAALASSTRFIELDATAWTTNTVRVMVRNISPVATFDLGPATLSAAVTKRRVPQSQFPGLHAAMGATVQPWAKSSSTRPMPSGCGS
jgi:hypothetical protein